MNNVTAIKLAAWSLSQFIAKANGAPIIFFGLRFILGINLIFLNIAAWLKAWQTYLFIYISTARIPATILQFVTKTLAQINAFFFLAHIFKSLFLNNRRLFDLLFTKSAFCLIKLIANSSNMVRLDFAANTKIFCAFITSNTISSHMNRSFFTHDLTIIIFLILLYLPLNKVHYISTGAFNKVRIFKKKLFFLVYLYRLFLVLIEIRIDFILLNILFTCWTPDLNILTQFIKCICHKTFFMDFMKALG